MEAYVSLQWSPVSDALATGAIQVNLMAALTRKQMVSKGPIPKILKLLPAIKPTYAMYPEYLDENGYGEHNIY